MKRLSLNFLFPLVALAMVIIVLDDEIFRVPPLGNFMNPFTGVVQNEQNSAVDKVFNLETNRDVEILFDDRAVPHIFAQDQSDLFFSQGFVCSADRLWQMDFLSYVAGGRLSEILGEKFIEHDKTQRRTGMLSAAESTLEFVEKNAQTKLALDNYTEGVNSYIETLSYKKLPIEYKIFNYKPEPWTNLKSVLIMKYMAAMLSGFEEDLNASYMLMSLGYEEFGKIFPDFYLSNDTGRVKLETVHDTLPKNDYIDYSFLKSKTLIALESSFNPAHGSNSWVIGPDKSQSGAAILCSDPHLDITLPSIWYEMQLNSAEQNTYGYSIPGVPGIVIGYNENISWGLTNGSTDVKDYYKLELKDDNTFYRYDGQWLPTEMRIEEIKVRNKDCVLDTVFYSMHGPIKIDTGMVKSELSGCAVNWTLHDPSNEFLTFLMLNKAKNYDDFRQAIKTYKCPVQNFSYADVKGNIALHHQGKIKKNKWKDQGKFIMDGTKSSHYVRDYLSDDELPYLLNPNQGYVYSANNNPYGRFDSTVIYGHYSEFRADKINSILSNKSTFSLADMQEMQTDNVSRHTELSLPILLEYMWEWEHPWIKRLRKWNYTYTKDSELGIAFEGWWVQVEINTWDELLKYGYVYKPNMMVLLDLLANDPTNKYFDIEATEEIETASDIVQMSFNDMWYNSILARDWGEFNRLNIRHLSKIKEFGRLGISRDGHPDAINAMIEESGPSLRMIVEMKDRPVGYGVYAGGQSGNPASSEYDRFVDDWLIGKYYKLNFYSDKEEANAGAKFKWSIK